MFVDGFVPVLDFSEYERAELYHAENQGAAEQSARRSNSFRQKAAATGRAARAWVARGHRAARSSSSSRLNEATSLRGRFAFGSTATGQPSFDASPSANASQTLPGTHILAIPARDFT